MNTDSFSSKEELDEVLAQALPEEQEALRNVWAWAGIQAYDTEVLHPARVDATWKALETAVQSPPIPRRQRARATQPRARGRLLGLGWSMAIGLVIVAIGVVVWLQPVRIDVAAGETQTLQLPDGTWVKLNSGSSLQYPRWFGETRRVALVGEGFFDVKSEARVFRVETFNAKVSVLGTRFNVQAWETSRQARTTVALEEGRVALASRHNEEEPIILHPGETRSVTNGTVSRPDTTALRSALAWRTGDFMFKDQALYAVLEEVERRFAVTIQYDPAVVSETRVNLSLRHPQTAVTVLEAVSVPLGLAYRPTASGYMLFPASDAQRP